MNFFDFESCSFLQKENEEMFYTLCDKMKNHAFESPWKMLFEDDIPSEQYFCGVQEFCLPGLRNSISHSIQSESLLSNFMKEKPNIHEAWTETEEKKIQVIEESMKKSLKFLLTDNLEGIELLSTLHPHQVPALYKKLESVMSTDVALALFFNSILSLASPLSLVTATALINHIIYPKVFKTNQKNVSRNLVASVLTFCQCYPRPMVDAAIVPCIKQSILETLQFEAIIKMTKAVLPAEDVAYCIRSIIDESQPNEKMFSVLQTLIERKINLETDLQSHLAKKVGSWSATWHTNMKFTKLLINILSVYGSKLNEETFFIYQTIVSHNKTVLKKAAENVLRNLQRRV